MVYINNYPVAKAKLRHYKRWVIQEIPRTRYEPGVSQVWVRCITTWTKWLLTTGQREARSSTHLTARSVERGAWRSYYRLVRLNELQMASSCSILRPCASIQDPSPSKQLLALSNYDELKNSMSKPDFVGVKKSSLIQDQNPCQPPTQCLSTLFHYVSCPCFI
jgi:hypothetical protein